MSRHADEPNKWYLYALTFIAVTTHGIDLVVIATLGLFFSGAILLVARGH